MKEDKEYQMHKRNRICVPGINEETYAEHKQHERSETKKEEREEHDEWGGVF